MSSLSRQRLGLSGGTKISVVTAGHRSKPALLLLHGFPSSARTFRDVMPELAKVAYVIAPDLPGHGESDVLPSTSFPAFAEAVSEVLDRLEVGSRFIHLFDYGAPVGLKIAMDEPDDVLGLIVQNANAHRTGFGPAWKRTLAYYFEAPDPENEAAATAHFTYEGVKAQYVRDIPPEIAARVSPKVWEEDWRVMSLPGRLGMQRALLDDYGGHIRRFDEIADYLAERHPSALMVWGRHDMFFDIAETLSWIKALPRMEAHILDGGHFLFETHAARAADLMRNFVEATSVAGDQTRARRAA